MKQLIFLLSILFLSFVSFNIYNIYIDKKINSNYESLKKSKNITIVSLNDVFDLNTIDNVSKKIFGDKDKGISGLTQDPVFTLQLNDVTNKESQSLFIDEIDTNSVYNKIINENRKNNFYSNDSNKN